MLAPKKSSGTITHPPYVTHSQNGAATIIITQLLKKDPIPPFTSLVLTGLHYIRLPTVHCIRFQYN